MKYFLDTEFIDKPNTIDLISIGIVAEDGREYYAISTEFDRLRAGLWVEKNVIALLPPIEDPAWKNRMQIAKEILDFVGDDLDAKFVGYYSSFDWVVFCWLFGPMIDLPRHFPQFCRDLKQLLVQYGNPRSPIDKGEKHNALADARWIKKTYEWCEDKFGLEGAIGA